MTPGGKHKRTKEGLQKQKDANDYMAAIMIAKRWRIMCYVFQGTHKEKWKKLCTTDNIIDLSVDAFILLADVLTSPILIIVRLVKHIVNIYFVERIKRAIKWFVHKVLRIK